jgi:hypothetical protein
MPEQRMVWPCFVSWPKPCSIPTSWLESPRFGLLYAITNLGTWRDSRRQTTEETEGKSGYMQKCERETGFFATIAARSKTWGDRPMHNSNRKFRTRLVNSNRRHKRTCDSSITNLWNNPRSSSSDSCWSTVV